MKKLMNPQRLTILILISLIMPIGIVGAAGIVEGSVLGIITIFVAILGGALALYNAPITDETPHASPLSYAERLEQAHQVRATRERERAFYEMTSTLSSTLDYQKVLESVLSVGDLITRQANAANRLVGAALLIQGEQGQLHVANHRGLTRKDTQQALKGQEGVLGLALRQADPVFAGQASRDPELQYFVAFQDCKSILAVPLQAGFDYYGVVVFGSPLADAFSVDYVDFLKSIGTQATIALQNAVLYRNILDEKERIVEVEEDARKKLARDLHDGPTQSIAAIAMRLNYIRKLLGDQHQQAASELGKVEDIARKTTKEIRHMLFTLRPLILETQGLAAALTQLAEKMRETHDLNVVIEAQPAAERVMDAHGQGVVFYIIEEAVNNARKHAQSKHIWVRLYQRDEYCVVEIEDDGVGFDQKAVTGNYETRGSLGMVNMRERAELIEGTLHMASAPGHGTKISVLVPAKQRQTEPITLPTPPAIRPVNMQPNAASSRPTSPSTDTVRPNAQIPHAGKRSPNS